jgi:DNA-binding NarL/FixJ family response regulator
VINAIHLASRGMQVIPRAPAGLGAPVAPGVGLLTKREAEVLPLLQQGHSNAQIALALGVGVETVRTHARNVYRKLGVRTRRELAAPPIPEADQQPDPAATRSFRARTLQPHRRPRRGHGVRHP